MFNHFDCFLSRLKTIREFCNTAYQFLKLEKVEIGGLRGRILTQGVQNIHDKFKCIYDAFGTKTYDCLNYTEYIFMKDYEKFNSDIWMLDRKLGQILSRAFDDCTVSESIFKLLDIFGDLTQRSLIALELSDKLPLLVVKLNQEMDDSLKVLTNYQKIIHCTGKPNCAKNMPAVSGQLRFIHDLRETIRKGVKSFKGLNHPICYSAGAELVFKKYKTMTSLMTTFEDKIYEDWVQMAKEQTMKGLDRPLLIRLPEQETLRVNFGRDTMAILSEVKHLQRSFQKRTIPTEALTIYERFEEFRYYNNCLEQIVELYNYLKTDTNQLEYKLFEDEMKAIDRLLNQAETTITWNSAGITELVEKIHLHVQELNSRVKKTQDNLIEIYKQASQWEQKPLFERIKRPNEEPLLDLENKEFKKEERYKTMTDAANKIRELVKHNEKLFEVELTSHLSKKSWNAYVKHLDKIVLESLLQSIAVSLGYLLDETDEEKMPGPLFKAEIHLCEPDIIFKPSLEKNIVGNFFDEAVSLVNDIFHMAALFTKNGTHVRSGENYLNTARNHSELKKLKDMYIERVENIIESAKEKKRSLIDFCYLWLESKQDYLYYFLQYARQLEQSEIEKITTDERSIKKKAPTLENYKEQIDYYEDVYNKIKKIECTQIFNFWFKVDVSPFKSTLLICAKRWSYMFKKHLLDDVVESLSELDEFIENADIGLQAQIGEGDYDGLIRIMEFLKTVKDKQRQYDDMFARVKNKIKLLRRYNVDIPEKSLKQLDTLPEKWANTKRLSVSARQSIVSLQKNEVVRLQSKIESYERTQRDFRNRFTQMSFFSKSCQTSYELLNAANKEIESMEEEINVLQSEAVLFDVSVPKFSLFQQCKQETKMLKQLWDYVYLVRTSIEEWRKTAWNELDVENMDAESKKFSKDIRSLDKSMREWNIFRGLETTVKHLLTSLRAVADLQNPAIRERHWEQLVQATNVRFVMTDETTFSDLLALNLHNHEDEVHNIVDKACKEMAMEKILKELDAEWSGMNFEHEEHKRTGNILLRASETMIETLEENQIQLQNMMTSKFIGHFLTEISGWQKTLSIVDHIITLWFDVQRTWSHLESIFVGSEDIRLQLPEDSVRFDTTNSEFTELMVEMAQVPNVIKATSREGLSEKLENIQSKLALCEKALSEYLETKRLAFPRFYFSSSADLLDILSNGNQPLLVAKHLTKLFDSMARIAMLDEKEKVTNIAIKMIAKDGEEVNFNEPCYCDGQVEKWLNSLVDTMRETMRHELLHSMDTYENTPREKWLFYYPAQVALTGTQIWWAYEVTSSFLLLEEGYDNALKDYYKQQIGQLNKLITLLLGSLTKGERQMVMTICTIDVHCRDVVSKMITLKIESSNAFIWQSQLRHRWDDEKEDCFVNICDAQFCYWHEYLGNTPRLVITPLTDRCYITLTQSLHLVMGGAPAGPAGTGKTETTKDLGKALGMMVYVFNCSEQMDYKSCGSIFKGLSQTGAWGCFDEFNRITVEVLSVIAVQVKSIQDAIKDFLDEFEFMGMRIRINPTIGYFITMNPGYAGRAELPENLKVLFRPCAMCVPDLRLICEIMLVAQGFLDARPLSAKFITLYKLCKELLSRQDHYDWGLRAIKSVLVVAGSLKRADRERPEEQVLMRALRDFNLPKIVVEDSPIFSGLISDLFPNLDVPRRRDQELEKSVIRAICDLKLQPEENFILKVTQLHELLDVRHSVFIIGDAGTGKTQTWKTLFKTYQNQKMKAVYTDLNPKAVSNDELYGVINPATREWKDGLFSNIMRDLANLTSEGPKWIVLDGDIDPMWVESLNTVMDDNKILTLASNERISLTPDMKLLFEVYSLKEATPATVSRAGILYINANDLGWNPFVLSWIETRKSTHEKSILSILFYKYVPLLHDQIRQKCQSVTPISGIAHIQLLCSLLDALIIPSNIPAESSQEQYEIYFAFAAIWAYGSAMYNDGQVDFRAEFSKHFKKHFDNLTFPTGSVFDVWVDPVSTEFVSWNDRVPKFELDPEVPLQACLVHNSETIRIKFFLDILVKVRFPCMLIGAAGCGKTLLMSEILNQLGDEYNITTVPFNFYYSAEMTQRILERPLEKKAGKSFSPPGNKKLIYFLDDMNMPKVDEYGTAGPHTIIRQHLDYGHWYCRNKLTLKEIHNTQYVTCMNPSAGSFTINPRLQRHFATFTVVLPGEDALFSIYNSILSGHLHNSSHKFPKPIQDHCENFVRASVQIHMRCIQCFSPTAAKFHYIFNLRDLTNVFIGMLFCTSETIADTIDMGRLWVHETQRVYLDKLCDEKDIDTFDKSQRDIIKKNFEELLESEVFVRPLIFCHFAKGLGESKYLPITEWDILANILKEALKGYNELNAAMDLVLFEDAMMHICKINRILESPRSNALLVGVGGSGKQSLSRLAAYISSMEVFQITLKKGYGVLDLKQDLANLYQKAGAKNIATMFLMSDAQVVDEKFLVLINNLLASGEIPDLFIDDDIENIITMVRTEVKAVGISDTRENCWKFFIDRVRKQLKIVLCFSPVGDVLRVRGRKFPAIVNCTSINWFHEWPQEALISVSTKFLVGNKHIPSDIVKPIGEFMALVHNSTNEMSRIYKTNDKRYNYTTPKSFLELINLYSKLLDNKNDELGGKIKRLGTGLEKLRETADLVKDLKTQLALQEIELDKKNAEADLLIQKVGVETKNVTQEKAAADEEKLRVDKINVDVKVKQIDCARDLKKAEPALIAAQEALNTLNKANLTELKSFGSPPSAVLMVTGAVMVLLLGQSGKIPKDRSWLKIKAMMAKLDHFLDSLIHFEKENINDNVLAALEPYLKDPQFDPDFVRTKSGAAAGLCSWVINVIKFFEVYCDVEPKRRALQEANDQLSDAQSRLTAIIDKVDQLETTLRDLTREYEEAVNEKVRCQEAAENTAKVISVANRLVNGLASENIRWGKSVKDLKEQASMLAGDVLLVTSFISYVGGFTKQYRTELLDKKWIPSLSKLSGSIPMSVGFVGANVLSLLTDDAIIAAWNNEGLPSDAMSTENATILTHSLKWPLMVDPQLQGLKWIKNKYGKSLKVIRLGQKRYMDTIEECVSNGKPLLIENLPEDIDPVLDPLLGRMLIKKGTAIKLGDKEVEYNPDFQLYLHTKMANPHYKPEIQALTTLINFTVTRTGLEDQLLAKVVKADRPDLEIQKSDCTRQQNEYKILLKSLEDDLLLRLNSAGDDILTDTSLVENLEHTKKTVGEIEEKVKFAKKTSTEIDTAREIYRTSAARASLLYFILNDLHRINPMYQFSLKAFNVVFDVAIARAESGATLQERVTNLTDSITFQVFQYTTRGLFRCDKLIFTVQMAFQILLMTNDLEPTELDFLLRFPSNPNTTSPVEFVSNIGWGAIKTLSTYEGFRNLDRDIENNATRWKKFVESDNPEKEKFPQEWKKKNAIQKLCIMRTLRPDRMTYAITNFIEEKLGTKYVTKRKIPFAESFEESGPSTPTFFVLSPGVNPLKEVEILGKQLGYTLANKNFYSISLGQGQEEIAEEAMTKAHLHGHWVVLQNIHLVKLWLPRLEKKIDEQADEAHPNYRLFLSADPAPSAASHIIPQTILEASIKITNEPPSGIFANLHSAMDNFNQDTLDMCSKEAEFKSILFSLCYFHAVVAERAKFGPQGWNKSYPFNTGDLVICSNVLYNYLEANNKVPWEDLRYLFGEIMYGGHITDDWDRRLCKVYLEKYIHPDQLDGELMLAPNFYSPPNTDYAGYHTYINENLPNESPLLYGLHANAEIGFLTATCEKLFKTVFELQPRESNSGDGQATTREEKVKTIIDDIMEKMPDQFNIQEFMLRCEERTPFIIVCFQECERMNILTGEMKRSLRELDFGLKGELTITTPMEELSNSLYFDQVHISQNKISENINDKNP